MPSVIAARPGSHCVRNLTSSKEAHTGQAPPIPISLYVHFPWCVKKCPYCDFNSHPATNPIPEAEYIACLLDDWTQQSEQLRGRRLVSVFFGGGTPSLFQPASFARLINRFSSHFEDAIEITMEANPGTLECGNLKDYRAAGILSLIHI